MIEIESQFTIALYCKGMAYSQLKKKDEAIKCLKEYIRLAKPNQENRINKKVEEAKQKIIELEGKI